MLPADTRDVAAAQGAMYQEKRVTQYWDGERALGGLVAKTLQLAEPVAWDVYLVFSPNTPWNGEMLPAPNFWMHQLNERPDRYLDAGKLMAVIHASVYS